MNIVYIMTDQWRWDTIFQPGHICQTPNLDHLSEEAVVFNNAYTCYPLCSPARGALFTGRWPYQNNLTDNVDGGSYCPNGKLHTGYKTYLERLRDDADYDISYSGKWHLGNGTLIERGINNVAMSDGGVQRTGRANPKAAKWSQPNPDGDTLWPYYSSFSSGVGRDARTVEAGIRQIEELAGGDKPFCSVISIHGPHFPHNIPRKFADIYADLPDDFWPPNYCQPFTEENKPFMQSRAYWPCQDTRYLTQEDWKKTCQHYWGYCSWLDDEFGKIFKRLKELELWESTVVAFSPDHGEKLGAHGHFDKGPDFYEETMHIPMIIREPSGQQARNHDSFVNLRDLFPTLISLAGAGEILSEEERNRSFWKTNNEHTFYSYDSYQGREFKLRGIHTERYKYNWSPHDLCELYDLQIDPGERNNLIASPEHSQIREELHAKLMEWMASEDDVLLGNKHLLPPGAYIDGRGVNEQHVHAGWRDKEALWRWKDRKDSDNE